jgi:hypothetical protein
MVGIESGAEILAVDGEPVAAAKWSHLIARLLNPGSHRLEGRSPDGERRTWAVNVAAGLSIKRN